MNKIVSKFFKGAGIFIAVFILIELGYSVITRTEIGKMIDVDFWILSYLMSLAAPSIFCKSENEKTEQE
jgi:hypothetical protein